MYFIGMTTAKSSIMKVFPEWAAHLGLGDVVIRGMDFKWHDEPAHYRRAVDFIKHDPLSLGALVTTHKIDLLEACRDRFDRLDPFADMMGEISSISKQGTELVGHAKDPITVGLSLDAFLPDDHWADTGAEVLILGAGGSARALSWHLMQEAHGANRPSKIITANRSTPRLEDMRRFHDGLVAGVPTAYHHTPTPDCSDRLVAELKPGSMVVNATGLGKDAPGSPLPDDVVFPERGVVWEFNYRGELVFLDQAKAQEASKQLLIEDGWVYFLHGWTRVIAEVFHMDIPTSGSEFDAISQIAAAVRR